MNMTGKDELAERVFRVLSGTSAVAAVDAVVHALHKHPLIDGVAMHVDIAGGRRPIDRRVGSLADEGEMDPT